MSDLSVKKDTQIPNDGLVRKDAGVDEKRSSQTIIVSIRAGGAKNDGVDVIGDVAVCSVSCVSCVLLFVCLADCGTLATNVSLEAIFLKCHIGVLFSGNTIQKS